MTIRLVNLDAQQRRPRGDQCQTSQTIPDHLAASRRHLPHQETISPLSCNGSAIGSCTAGCRCTSAGCCITARCWCAAGCRYASAGRPYSGAGPRRHGCRLSPFRLIPCHRALIRPFHYGSPSNIARSLRDLVCVVVFRPKETSAALNRPPPMSTMRTSYRASPWLRIAI